MKWFQLDDTPSDPRFVRSFEFGLRGQGSRESVVFVAAHGARPGVSVDRQKRPSMGRAAEAVAEWPISFIAE